jgi:hypothetical protein
LVKEDEDKDVYDPHWRTDYQLSLTNLPDDEGDPTRDLYALQACPTQQDSVDHHSDSASVSSRASSLASSAPRSASPEPQYGSWEEHSQWLADGCPPEYREPGIYVCLLLKSVPLRDTIGNGGSLSWDEQTFRITSPRSPRSTTLVLHWTSLALLRHRTPLHTDMTFNPNVDWRLCRVVAV